jgi:hypothetical protein
MLNWPGISCRDVLDVAVPLTDGVKFANFEVCMCVYLYSHNPSFFAVLIIIEDTQDLTVVKGRSSVALELCSTGL